jgi:hypothetical protein
MADESGLNPFVFPLQGGLVLDRSTFTMEPGMALELQNFEADITGGYRRINGYTKWNSNVVPQTASSSEAVLMSAYFAGNDKVIAARGTKVYEAASGSGAWSAIDTGRSNATKYTFFRYNFNNTPHIIWADGANHATKYDGSTVTDINGTGAPSNPKYVTSFKNTMFFAGMSSTPQELLFTAPYTDNDFSSANGAGSIRVDDTITGIFPFRDTLIIFCAERIFRLVGNTVADFQLQPVSRNVGCINGSTIKEFAGDIIFLSRDGLRTVAGTEKIGDVELGTISASVHELFSVYTDVDEFEAVVVPDKTQYRIFFVNNSARSRAATKGVIAYRGAQGYTYSELLGIQPSCTDSLNEQGSVYVLHGGFDGYVYRQEQGSTFDGETIVGRYRSPDLTMGDAGIRKNFQRVIINYAPTGTVNSDLFLRYDYEDPNIPRPAAYPFDSSKVVAIYGTSAYGTATYGGQSQPLVRQAVEGSGFAVALRVVDNGVSEPYSLKGFQLEFDASARR